MAYTIGEDGEVADQPRKTWMVYGRMWTVWPLTFAGVLGTLIVLGSIRWEGLYDQATAAWVQAVGTVAAIALAVVVDANAARRARADRLFAEHNRRKWR